MSKYFIFSRIPPYYHNMWYVGQLYPIQTSENIFGRTWCYVRSNDHRVGWLQIPNRDENWAYEVVDGPKKVTQEDIEELL